MAAIGVLAVIADPAVQNGHRARAIRRMFAGSELWTSAGIVFAGNLVARALGFLFPVVVARATDRSGFALVYFFISTGWFVSELVLTGFPTAFTRALAADRAAGGAWLTSSLAGGLPLLGVSLIGGAVLAYAAHEPPLLMSLVVIGLTIDAYYFALLRGFGRFGLLAGYRVAANLVQIVVLLGFLWAGIASPEVMIALYSFVYLIPIAAIELAQGPLRHLLHSAPRPTRERVVLLARFALPSLISGTAFAAILGLDVFFVRIFAPEALADYGAARTLALPMTFFPYAVGTVLLPRVPNASIVQRWSMLRRALTVSTAIGALLTLGYAAAGPFLLDITFPSADANAAGALETLVPACGLIGLYSILSQWWFGVGRPALPAVSLSIGALVALASHLVLTTSHGSIGAGFSIAAGTTTALVILGMATLRMRAREQAASVLSSAT